MAMAGSLKEFLTEALRQDQRLDGRRPFDCRSLTIDLLREDGLAEVQLGQTRIVCVVTCQLVQPYPDQPNEGSLVVYAEFSPMADPTFEAGRPGENAVELGRVVERGLRDSRAIDTESLCVLSGKAVWSLRVDIHVVDNGGNLIDAACIAALAALLSFRRPECGLAGTQGQDVVIYPPEVMDPSYKEEVLMEGRLTIIMNIHGDICAIQKAGVVGVSACNILHCLQIASTKIAEVTSSLRKAVEEHEFGRTHLKTKRQQNFHEIEAVTIMWSGQEGHGALLEDDTVANILNTLDPEASSDKCSDSSTCEKVIDFSYANHLRVVKQEGTRTTGKPECRQYSLVASLLSDSQAERGKEIGKSSSEFITKLHTDRAVEVQGSVFGPAEHRSESETMNNPVSHQLERLSIQMSADVRNVERLHASSLKSKPRSLLDAVKWEKVKAKRAGAMQS